ncbi:tripartite tricarboxylate transporter permease [Corynebacterium uberis]|uniref:tripartite tricarboxylate transporter permease n=1 Tax=Corynebacterium TaxID=1716 RepID=UPI001D0B1DBF|nr:MULTISPECIES: tripartite tricarboxylate transporter permease [Corynebacterium]MCZ9308861.1 tripartite tricarboxylate transporter permease [Corynebacterium sp. c6VSa_13]UDL74660.1 tripartite tricarboxylate transporter permease [Corynebacterium uberis]UDL76506.1 tripartite tricarboxylate transporter permease [Corynebacterium uberis]UDL78718.1 tripartite tricarboxylate transporter permease [Corynebacterium uberis]UDL80997.1 tripartite tricarboxylate transporter permease [Corynebacterium uberis
MDLMLVAQMLIAAVAAIGLYTFIGFIPGTDETSVLVPVTLALVLAGTDPHVILAFFIAAIVTLNLTNAIPTALVGLPGGVLSTPMMEDSLYLRAKGLAGSTIRKMAAGSAVGTVIAIPVSLAIATAIAPYADTLRQYGSLIFVIGAVVLALLGSNRLLSLVAIIPMSLLFQGLLSLYRAQGVIPEDGSISVSFFLGITIGPLLVALLGLLNKSQRERLPRQQPTRVSISRRSLGGGELSPTKILTRGELGATSLWSLVTTPLFFLSPVGLTFLLGRLSQGRSTDRVVRANRAVSSMNGIAHASYLSGTIIPLLALGIPLSPVAIGPAQALFNAPPVLSLDNNLHHLLSTGGFIAAVLIGAVVALVLTYIIAVRYSHMITYFVMRYIAHEAVLGLFIGFIVLLAYLDAGVLNIFGVLLVGVSCGTLNKLGVGYGVQFMTLYASPWIVQHLL